MDLLVKEMNRYKKLCFSILFPLFFLASSHAALNVHELKDLSTPLRPEFRYLSPAYGYIFAHGHFLQRIHELHILQVHPQGAKIFQEAYQAGDGGVPAEEKNLVTDMVLLKKLIKHTHHLINGHWTLTTLPHKFSSYLTSSVVGVLTSSLVGASVPSDLKNRMLTALRQQDKWKEEIEKTPLAYVKKLKTLTEYPELMLGLKDIKNKDGRNDFIIKLRRSNPNIDLIFKDLHKRCPYKDTDVLKLLEKISPEVASRDQDHDQDRDQSIVLEVRARLVQSIEKSMGEFLRELIEIVPHIHNRFMLPAFLSSILVQNSHHKEDFIPYYRALQENLGALKDDWVYLAQDRASLPLAAAPSAALPPLPVPLAEPELKLTQWSEDIFYRDGTRTPAVLSPSPLLSQLSLDERIFHITSTNLRSWPLESYQSVEIGDAYFSDCVEVALRNFFKIILNKNGRYDLVFLDHLQLAHPGIRAFFEHYPTPLAQTQHEASLDWARVLSGLGPHIRYLRASAPRKELDCELKSHPDNILAVLSHLFGREFRNWKDLFDRLQMLKASYASLPTSSPSASPSRALKAAAESNTLQLVRVEPEEGESMGDWGGLTEKNILFWSPQEGHFNWMIKDGHSAIDPLEDLSAYEENKKEIQAFLIAQREADAILWTPEDYLFLSLYPNVLIKKQVLEQYLSPQRRYLLPVLTELETRPLVLGAPGESLSSDWPLTAFISKMTRVLFPNQLNQEKIDESFKTRPISVVSLSDFLTKIPAETKPAFAALMFDHPESCRIYPHLLTNSPLYDQSLLFSYFEVDPKGTCFGTIQSYITQMPISDFKDLFNYVVIDILSKPEIYSLPSFKLFLNSSLEIIKSTLQTMPAIKGLARFEILSDTLGIYENLSACRRDFIRGNASSALPGPSFLESPFEALNALLKSHFALWTSDVQNNQELLNQLVLAAVMTKNEAIALDILALGIPLDPSLKDKFGRTSLHWSVFNSMPRVAKLLMEKHSFTPEAKDDGGQSVLDLFLDSYEADDAGLGREILERIKGLAPDVLSSIIFGNALLHRSLTRRKDDITSKLVEVFPELVQEVFYNGGTIISSLVHYRPLDSTAEKFFEIFVRAGADINQAEPPAYPPIMIAIINQNKDWIQFLLDKGANPFGPFGHNQTGLHYASQRSDEELLVQLVRQLPRFYPSTSPATYKLKKQEILDTQDSQGRTALYYAMEYFNPNNAHLLLDNGVDPGLVASDGLSPLYMAVKDSRSVNLIQKMLEHPQMQSKKKEIIERANSQGQTVLHLAFLKRNIALIKLLISHGADIKAQDNNGLTPQDYIRVHRLEGLDEFSSTAPLDEAFDPDLESLR